MIVGTVPVAHMALIDPTLNFEGFEFDTARLIGS